jgi:hypothetical protein
VDKTERKIKENEKKESLSFTDDGAEIPSCHPSRRCVTVPNL